MAKLVEREIVHLVEEVVFKDNSEAIGGRHGVSDEVFCEWIPFNLFPWAQASEDRVDRVRAGKAEGEAQVVANNEGRRNLAGDAVGTRSIDVLYPVCVSALCEAHRTVAQSDVQGLVRAHFDHTLGKRVLLVNRNRSCPWLEKGLPLRKPGVVAVCLNTDR